MSGMVLPHARESEQTVLGAILLSPACYPEVAAQLQPSDFTHPANAAIYAAMTALDNTGRPIDAITVAEQVRTAGDAMKLRAVGDAAYLGELMSAVVTVDNVGWHAKRVARKAERRRVIEVCQGIQAAGYGDEDDAAFLEAAESALYALQQGRRGEGPAKLSEGVRAVVDALEARYDSGETVTGIRSGWNEWDALTGGLQPSKLYVVAARPAMGKTAWALDLCLNAASRGVPSLGFSIEMALEELAARSLSSVGRVNGEVFRCGKLTPDEWRRLTRGGSQLHGLPVWIDADGSPTIQQLRNRARRWRADKTAGGASEQAIVWVDYLQLVRNGGKGKSDNREREVAEVSRGLKALAKELRVPVVALAQLNRGCEARADKRPTLADLRESGAVEQDADLVAFLYRDEVYNAASSRKGICDVIVSKHRAGRSGVVSLRWLPQFTRFEEMPS